MLDDLPEKKAYAIWLTMEDRQRAAYDRAEQEARVYLKSLGEEVTVGHILPRLLYLKQLCNRDPQSGESIKLAALEEDLEEAIAEGSKALVYSQFLDEGVTFLAEHFARFNPAVVTGQVSGTRRDAAVDRFQKDETCIHVV